MFARDRVDDYLARANVRGIRIPPFLREDQEHFVENVNSIVPGYGADIANDINVQLLNKDQLLLKGEHGEILFSGTNVPTVHSVRRSYELLSGKLRCTHNSNIMEF